MNREQKIVELRNKRYTMGQLGKLFGISRQRVHQIIMGFDGYTPEFMEILSTSGARAKNDTKDIKVSPKLSGRERTREIVRMRDNHTCQLCGSQRLAGKQRLDVHHIDCDKRKSRGYDRLSEIPNMITLCHRCHSHIPSHIRSMEKAGEKRQVPFKK